MTLAPILAALGDYAGAVRTAEQLAALDGDPANAYKAGCIMAQCIRMIEKGGKLSDAKRKELLHSYTERGIAVLQQALAKGYKDAAHMKNDADLEPLRSQPLFQKFLKGSALSARREGSQPKPKMEFAVGRTQDALMDLATLSAAKPDDTLLLLELATLQAWFGQDKELAATCRRGLELAKDTAVPETAERAAKVCCLLP
jgi:hypothetical protein